MRKARIDGGIVREVLDIEPFPPFHPSMIWVECAPEVVEFYTYSNGVFTAPPPPDPTVIARGVKDAADAAAARVDIKLQVLAAMSPAQARAWVNANVNNLADAKDALGTLAAAVVVLARRL